jgi:hypothetical protein
MKKKCLLFLLLLSTGLLSAQVNSNVNPFSVYEDSLRVMGKAITNDTIEANRVTANYGFIKTLVSTLKQKGSFAYPFDSLVNTVSIQKSEDNKFRIFSWFVMSDDGSFRFYGALQMNNPDQLELYPFTDNFAKMESPEDSTLTPKKWYGAVYYTIVPVNATADNKPYYILLGWKGTSHQSTKKVIDVLSFDNGKPVFGLPVFVDKEKEGKFKKRVVFSYTTEVSMLLRYVKDKGNIVFDHLVPPNEKLKNMPSLYGPDLTYDAYKFKKGKWYLQENVDLKNLPNGIAEDFVNPKSIVGGQGTAD